MDIEEMPLVFPQSSKAMQHILCLQEIILIHCEL